eukprot:6996948-Prorocentrum_lima.AAC.1
MDDSCNNTAGTFATTNTQHNLYYHHGRTDGQRGTGTNANSRPRTTDMGPLQVHGRAPKTERQTTNTRRRRTNST